MRRRLHWADPTTLALMRAPLLILATMGPEFRPPWSLRYITASVGEISARHGLSKDVIGAVSNRTGGCGCSLRQ